MADLRILLVEDNVGDQRLIARAVTEVGPELALEVAGDGVIALDRLRGGAESDTPPHFDFVLLDLNLPRQGGLDVLAEIKRDPALRRIPVIVLTSSEAPTDIAAAYEGQASAYFVKPVSDFGPVVRQILGFMRAAQLPTGELAANDVPGRRTHVPPRVPSSFEADRSERLAAIVRSSTDAIISFDCDGTIQSWNPAAEQLYGYTEAEAIGRPMQLIVPQHREHEFERLLATVAGGGAVERFETERVDRDGRPLAISLTVSPICDRYGVVSGVSAIARDVTERKQAEERFRLAVESSPSAMLMVDAAGAIVMGNAEAQRMFGFERDELVGQSIEILVPRRFTEAHPEHRSMFMRKPEARTMGAGRDLYAVRKDGSEFPVEIGLNPIETSEGVFVLSAIVDITERKQAEERFRLAVESSPNGMVMVDASGTIVLVNAETERMFGYSRDELVGSTVGTLVPTRFRGQHPRHREAFHRDPAARVMGAGRELYAVRKDGTEFPVEIGLNPIETPDGMFVLSAIVDITERKQAQDALARRTEELARSNAQLQQFAYVASHDLQEPLRMVASFTRLLEQEYSELLDEAGREYVQFAVDGAVRMQNLIRDLLAYARVSTRAEKRLVVESAEAAQLALTNLALAIGENDAIVEIDALPPVRVFEGQLGEVFQNLIANAIRFRGDARPRVRVRAHPRGPMVEFSVADNGIGIAPEHHEEVFEVFRRLHTRPAYEGTGIGLAICKRIVEHNGGRIWLESAVGRGTTVYFTLPRA